MIECFVFCDAACEASVLRRLFCPLKISASFFLPVQKFTYNFHRHRASPLKSPSKCPRVLCAWRVTAAKKEADSPLAERRETTPPPPPLRRFSWPHLPRATPTDSTNTTAATNGSVQAIIAVSRHTSSTREEGTTAPAPSYPNLNTPRVPITH